MRVRSATCARSSTSTSGACCSSTKTTRGPFVAVCALAVRNAICPVVVLVV